MSIYISEGSGVFRKKVFFEDVDILKCCSGSANVIHDCALINNSCTKINNCTSVKIVLVVFVSSWC